LPGGILPGIINDGGWQKEKMVKIGQPILGLVESPWLSVLWMLKG
jgi:hypothetical protein